MASRRITVEFLGDSSDLERAISGAERRTSTFGSKLKSIGKMAAIGLGAGVLVAGKALYDMTKAAAEDEAGQKRLATALKNTAGATDSQIASVEDWISAQGKAYGVADDDLRPALAKLAQATGDVGKAQKLASLAMNVSAGTGKSLESVSTALMKAQMGQVSALSRLGVQTKNAKGETLSFSQVTKNMAETFKGQAAKHANTFQGQMERLKLTLSETGESIGAKLLPIATKLSTWFLDKGLPAMEAFGGYLGRVVPPVFARIQAVISKFTGKGGGDLSEFVNDVKSVFRDGITIVTRMWDLFGANVLQFLGSTVKNIVQVLKGLFQIVKGIFEVISGVLTGDWSKAWQGVKDILGGAVKIIVALVRQLFNQVRLIWKNLWVLIQKIAHGAWEGIKNLFRGALRGLVNLVKGWFRLEVAAWRAFGRLLWSVVKAIWGKIRDAVKAGIDFVKNIIRADLALVRSIFSSAWNAVRDGVRNAWSTIKSLVRDGISTIVGFIHDLPGKVRDLGGQMLDAGKAMMGKLFEGIRSAVSGVAGFASDIAQSIKDAINDVLHLPFTIHGPGPLPDFTIPKFAKGTNFAPGGLALVGERGPELVDLPRGSRVSTAAQTRRRVSAMEAGDDRPIVVQFLLDGKMIEQALIKRTRTTGRPLQVSFA